MYRKLIIGRVLFGFFLFFLLVLFSLISLSVGEFEVPIYNLITGQIDENLRHIIFNLRLIRILGAITAGAAIGVSGCVLQNILRNPLASPLTLGVTQGAAFGATFAIIVLSASFNFKYMIVLSAFTASLIAVAGILIVSFFAGSATESIILAGVGIGSFFNAGIMFLKYFANDIQVASAVFWTFGDLAKSDWGNVSVITLFLIPGLFFFVFNAWNYNAFIWGEDSAKSLGVKIKTLTIFTLLISSLVSSVATAFLGIIGFIGLVAPHIVRMAIGNDYRFLIPFSAISGALLLVISDIVARTILKPVMLPVGIITAFAGVPLFLYILIRSKKKKDVTGKRA